jgi:hypothetical protein
MPQPETPTARATEESRPVTEPTDLTALRAAARAAVDVPGGEPVRWRVVSIEYGGGIAPVCTATEYAFGASSHPTHLLDADVFGPDARDDLGPYDCCPRPWIEVWSEEMAAYMVALLNGDAGAINAEACQVHEFRPEYQGVSDAKRRLANCDDCGHSRRADCHPPTATA